MNKKILIYGFGNPGRQDDGLGVLLVEKIEHWVKELNLQQLVRTESNYQLNIEDSELIKDFDLVVFVDASTEDIENIKFEKLKPSTPQVEFTMHASSPGFVLHLCNKLFNSNPESYLLHIKGYEWEMKETITSRANKNLNKAFEFLTGYIKKTLDAH